MPIDKVQKAKDGLKKLQSQKKALDKKIVDAEKKVAAEIKAAEKAATKPAKKPAAKKPAKKTITEKVVAKLTK